MLFSYIPLREEVHELLIPLLCSEHKSFRENRSFCAETHITTLILFTPLIESLGSRISLIL